MWPYTFASEKMRSSSDQLSISFIIYAQGSQSHERYLCQKTGGNSPHAQLCIQAQTWFWSSTAAAAAMVSFISLSEMVVANKTDFGRHP